jgi:hypothetical protein
MIQPVTQDSYDMLVEEREVLREQNRQLREVVRVCDDVLQHMAREESAALERLPAELFQKLLRARDMLRVLR